MSDISKLIKPEVINLTPSLIRKFNSEFKKIPGIVDLTIGEPDFETADHIKLADIKSVINDRTHYAPNRGTIELRTSISNYLHRRFDLKYDPSTQIVVTNGASEAISTVFNGLIEKDDVVLISSPAFSLYETLTKLNKGTPIAVDVSKHGFKLTPDVLDEALKKYQQRVKLVVLNYPNNPTGITYTPIEVANLAKVLEKYQVAILSDEVYSELSYESEHVSIAKYLPEQTLLVSSVSKSYAMTGWRVGYLCGTEKVIQELAKVHQANVATIGTMNMDAATEAFENGRSDIKKMKTIYDQRRKYLCQALKQIGFEFVPPQGAFYLYVKVPDEFLGSSSDYARKLAKEALIATVPGVAFETSSKYFRISYATSQENLELAVKRLTKFIQQ